MIDDLFYAIRIFSRRPLITVVTLLTIALGTGANTAVFSVVSAVLLRPLPYPEPDRIVRLWEDSPQPGPDPYFASMGMIRDWRGAASLLHVSEFYVLDVNLADGSGLPERVHAVGAGWRLSHVLGLVPHRGRFFVDSDYDNYAGHNAVLLSHGFWQQRYGARDDAIGRPIGIDGHAATIVGVLPPATDFEGAQVWVNHNDANTRYQPRYLHALAQLAPGATSIRHGRNWR